MRIGKVVGRISLSQSHEALVGGRYVIVEVQDRFALAGRPRKSVDTIVVYDHLGAHEGDLIGVAESREACAPFYPEKRVPLDAYCAAILDVAKVSFEI